VFLYISWAPKVPRLLGEFAKSQIDSQIPKILGKFPSIGGPGANEQMISRLIWCDGSPSFAVSSSSLHAFCVFVHWLRCRRRGAGAGAYGIVTLLNVASYDYWTAQLPGRREQRQYNGCKPIRKNWGTTGTTHNCRKTYHQFNFSVTTVYAVLLLLPDLRYAAFWMRQPMNLVLHRNKLLNVATRYKKAPAPQASKCRPALRHFFGLLVLFLWGPSSAEHGEHA